MTELDAMRRTEFRLLNPKELSAILGVSEDTLALWRVNKTGPDYTKLGRSIFYRREDVDEWIKANVVVTRRTVE